MTKFSELLKNYIHKKNISVSAMAHQLKFDRANLYKVINGKRNPSSRENARHISEYLELTPSEQVEFMEAYRIAEIGPDIYYQRKSALHFLLNSFSSQPSSFSLEPVAYSKTTSLVDLPDGTVPLYDKAQIHQMLSLICRQAALSESPNIKVIAQPDWSYLMSLFQALGHLNANLIIDQIICLNTGDEPKQAGNILYNISVFEKIMPLFSCSCSYTPHFYYDKIDSHFNNLQLFPYAIITEDYTLVCSSDISHGLLYHQHDVRNLYSGYYQKQLTQTSELFQKLNVDVMTYIKVTQENLGNALETAPCFLMLTDPDMLETIIRIPPELETVFPGSEGRKAFLSALQSHIDKSNEYTIHADKMIATFSDGALQYFMETGRVLSYPDELYDPLPPALRLKILQRFYDNCDTVRHRLLKGALAHMALGLGILITNKGGCLLLRNSEDQLIYLPLKEKTLLSTLNDFVSHLEEEGFLCTMAETKDYLKTVIEKYSKYMGLSH